MHFRTMILSIVTCYIYVLFCYTVIFIIFLKAVVHNSGPAVKKVAVVAQPVVAAVGYGHGGHGAGLGFAGGAYGGGLGY